MLRTSGRPLLQGLHRPILYHTLLSLGQHQYIYPSRFLNNLPILFNKLPTQDISRLLDSSLDSKRFEQGSRI